MTHTIPSQIGKPYRNRLLFTEHYLDDRVKKMAEWQSAINSAVPIFEQLRDHRATIKTDALIDQKESQLEALYIQWVLEHVLNHTYAVQVTLDFGDGKRGIPDYVILAADGDASALGKAMHQPADLDAVNALAVGDAKQWGTNFDKSSKGQRSPYQQIDQYLRYSERKWGFLTDGRIWRLYERNSSKYNHYYEVDLDALIEANDISGFLYFYLFFRQQALTTGWLDDVLRGSDDYAEALRDSLEEEVFTALEDIAQGFLEYRRNQFKRPPQQPTLHDIYQASLIVLYRLLFIFYAESRNILPVNQDLYQSRSIAQIVKTIDERRMGDKTYSEIDGTKLYAELDDLFFRIDAGDPQFDMPAYNGRLFSNDEHPFLAQNRVGDKYMASALNKLARVEVMRDKKLERVAVDYQDLEVSHLGTIYEKLLEYELDYAKEPLVVTGKNQTYKPAPAGQTPQKPAGKVYLRTGNNQRKVTGSYYTPDYVVRFIVEKTLEPLLLDITRRYAEQDENGEWQVHNAVALRDDILALNVLDPATGSGHFVVDVVVYMAEWLVALGLTLPELADETDELAYWMRQVAASCIYAVDINPLAVELAKLSLWLKTLERDKPLSFLDHHVRVGNSLVGTTLQEIEALIDNGSKPTQKRKKAAPTDQPALFGEEAFTLSVSNAVSIMTQIETTRADDVSDVKQQETLYRQLRERLQPYEQLATLWTAQHFGLSITPDQWRDAYTLLRANSDLTKPVQDLLEQAQAIALEPDKRFFHWDVAFPEVFYDSKGQPRPDAGFDAVIGNPPYVRQERLKAIKPYLSQHYEVYSGTADLFLYFYERGLRFVKPGQRLGYITSGTFYNSNSAKPFRDYINQNAAFEWVANFGENQPFKEAEMVYPTIAIVRTAAPEKTFRHLFIAGNVPRAELGDALKMGEWHQTLSSITTMDEWRFQAVELTELFRKVTEGYTPLSEVASEIYRGIVTGFNEAFIIDEDTRETLIQQDSTSNEVIKPIVQGQDLRPWYQIKRQQYVIFTRRGIEIDKYPAIKAYLEKYRKQLEPRPHNHKGDWSGRKAGSYQWYEIQDDIAYYNTFEQPKILGPDIAKLPRFSWDETGLYCNDKGTLIVVPSQSFLSVLNSRVIWFTLSQIATPLRLRAGLWQYQSKLQFIKRLPIPTLTPQQERELAEIAERITDTARSRYQLHDETRRNISLSLANREPISTRISLYAWWQLADVAALDDEIQKRFNTSIPVRQRTEWDTYLSEQRAEHKRLTDAIMQDETRLNAIVYDAFGLDEAERQLIEKHTAYPYGEV